MEFVWHPEAVAEADAAATFYRTQHRQLARRFVNQLSEALERIAFKPAIYREVQNGIRKIRLRAFPYAVMTGSGGTEQRSTR
jgi:plasmid stabilization system protein ParE